MPTAEPEKARVLLFDIESTDLEASFGHVLCFGYRYWDRPTTQVLSVRDVPRPRRSEEPDAPLMRRVHQILRDRADVIVSWYGKEFDVRFLNARMLLAGLPPLPPFGRNHVDLYFISRQNFCLHSGRLQGFAEAFGCPIDKTPVRADIWRLANRGDATALRYVVKHCRRDVDILHWAYGLLRPYVRTHPPVTPHAHACPVCGGQDWRSNGWRFRRGGRHQRLQCQACGHWVYANERGAHVY